jgi:hypothetical protein
MVREGLPEIDLITVRSQLDFEQLDPSRDCNAHVTACPTLLFSNPNEDSNNRDGVNFLPWFLGERKQYGAHIGDNQDLSDYFGYDSNISVGDARDAYITNAQRICSQLQNPIFIPFTKDDERFARNYLDVEIQPYTFSVTETFRRVSEVDRMVTTRFHCLIFATVCEKPTLVLAYAPKVSSLAERLGIPSYKPHHEIPVEFHNVSNLGSVRRSAMENFRLLDEYVLRYGENRSYSIGEDNLTDPYSIAH